MQKIESLNAFDNSDQHQMLSHADDTAEAENIFLQDYLLDGSFFENVVFP